MYNTNTTPQTSKFRDIDVGNGGVRNTTGMASSGNVAGDNVVDDRSVGEITGMAGICNVPGNRATNFSRHFKDLTFMSVMILQVIRILLLMVVIFCFFYMKELLALFSLILIYKKWSILPIHAM